MLPLCNKTLIDEYNVVPGQLEIKFLKLVHLHPIIIITLRLSFSIYHTRTKNVNHLRQSSLLTCVVLYEIINDVFQKSGLAFFVFFVFFLTTHPIFEYHQLYC